MKTPLYLKFILSGTLSLFAASAFAVNYNKTYQTNASTDIDFSGITWTDVEITGGEADNKRDKYYLNVNNSESSNIHVRNGATQVIEGAAYTQGNTNLIIGDASESDSKFIVRTPTGGKDIFFEITSGSSITINKGATFIMENGTYMRYWGLSAGAPDRVSINVNGGTFIGGLTIGYDVENPNAANVEFKNGAKYLSSANNGMDFKGISNVTFNASSYETYNSGWDTTTSTGWRGNAFYLNKNFNIANQVGTHTYTAHLLMENGSRLNGGGAADGTYYDFAAGDVSLLTNGSKINMEVGYLSKDTNSANFSILSGSKVSGGSFSIGSSNTRLGSANVLVQGSGAEFTNLSEVALSEWIVFNFSQQYDVVDGVNTVIDNTFKSDFHMAGDAKLNSRRSIQFGDNNTLGGSATFRVTGDNNTVLLNDNINFYGGANYKEGLSSNAKMYLLVGKDNEGNVATNSTFSWTGDMNMNNAGNTEMHTRFAGATNTFTQTSGKSVWMRSSSALGGTSKTTFELTDGAKFTTSNVGVYLNASGTSNVLVSNGAELTVGKIEVTTDNNTIFKDSTSVANVILDSAKITNTGDLNLGKNELLNGTINLKMIGDGSSLSIGSNLNINGGWNSWNDSTPIYSEAKIRVYLGKDDDGNVATNSTFNLTGTLYVNPGANSDILVRFAGDTNTFTHGGNFSVNNARVVGGNSTAKFEFTDGATATVGRFGLNAQASGETVIEVKNGANITSKAIAFGGSNSDAYAGGTSHMKLIVKNATFTGGLGSNFDLSLNDVKNSVHALIKLEGDATFVAEEQMNMGNTNNAISSSFKIDISGDNNTFTASKNLNLNGTTAGDFVYGVSMTGANNTFAVGTNGGNLSLRQNASTGGQTIFNFVGSSSAQKNNVIIGSRNIVAHGITNGVVSTNKTSFLFGGNTILSGNGTSGSYTTVTLKMHEDGNTVFTGGTSRFDVKGAGNELYFNEWKMGNDKSTGGQAVFSVTGGGSKIYVGNNAQIMGSTNTSISNVIGGKLEYHIDDTGITSIDFDTNNYNFSGILEIDFGKITEPMDNERFLLMTSTTTGNNFKDALEAYWFDLNTGALKGNVDVQTRDESDIYRFALEGSAGDWELVVYYTSIVPEPSAYAAIFGAIALAFAAYRRKRN